MKTAVQFYDELAVGPDVSTELRDGLRARSVPPKYFYDARGSALFDQICELPEYYLTRSEIAILRAHACDIAERAPRDAVLVELGSGASLKVRLLLDALRPSAYLGIDISRDFLGAATRRLARDYPWLEVHAACADYSQELSLSYPPPERARLVFFPGSSIGNFTRTEARAFLARLTSLVRPGGALVVGVDLRKDPQVIRAAYNDTHGITAAFNRNLLQRLKREFGADVDPQAFAHEAVYDEAHGRIEMYLVSEKDQEIGMQGEAFRFAAGERLHTEYSYKYSIEEFQALARAAGYHPETVWTDARSYFSVHYLRLPT
jgi:dimethylhistidine N-methyltransferase